MMNKLKILLVEDDPIHAANVEMLLDEMGYQLAGLAKGYEEALRLFMATKPDLVLMDIDLSDEKDGIQLAARINAINPIPLIFLTAFSDNQTFERAKAIEPYAYLVKPVSANELQRNIELAVYRFAKSFWREEVATDHFTGWSANIMLQDAVFVKMADRLEKVSYADILWIEVSTDRYCEIKTKDKSFTVRASLKNLEERLSPYQFMRVHRAYIVNMAHLESINDKDMTLTIAGSTVPMGSLYKQIILDKLNIL